MKNRDKYMEKVTIGKRELLNGKIVLDEYNPLWPVLFNQEATRIRNALGNRARQIHHVGSTAIPGLCAKPIIDILLVVADASDELAYVSDLELLGYTLRIREPDWFQHRLLRGPNSDINLHVFSENTSEVQRMLRFRDWLLKNDSDKQKYKNEKRRLAQQIWQYVQDYADAKTAVIQEIMERASTNTS